MATACFYNVEHGDYIAIVTDNNISIIRDCGSLDATTKQSLLLPNLTPCYKGTSKHEAIVSHPHEDHYYGFEKLHACITDNKHKFFNTSYVPILYLNSTPQDIEILDSGNGNLQDLSLTALAVKVALHIRKHLYQGTNAPNPTNWLRVAPLMADLSDQLVGVHAGATFFNHWEPKGTVIWPPHLGSTYYKKNHKKLSGLLTGGLFANDDIDKYVIEVLKLIEDIKNHSQQSPFASYLSRIDSILSSISPEPQIDAPHANIVDNDAQKLGTFIDDHSIVFSIGESEDSALFLSDLNKPAMNMMVDDMNILDNNDQYTFVKSAHHGTRLSKKLFARLSCQAQPLHTIVHSCGAGQGNSREPDSQQDKYQNLKPKSVIDCTSWKKTSSWSQPCPFNKFSNNHKCYIL